MHVRHERKTCVIVGAGVSGLVQAAELVRRHILLHDDIAILERAADYGGVWTAATYPGAACDVFSILYQISWFKNPYWTGLFPTSKELVNYYNVFADHYGLRQFTTFGHRVISASWSAEDCLWEVVGEDLATGEETLWQCDVLVQATGTYNRKKLPALEGIQEFRGDMWHTVDWPQHFDFAGKSVAYVGTGPTALQALPVVQHRASSLTIFMRSMTYCHPFPAVRYHPSLIWMFSSIPGLLWLYAVVLSYGFGVWTWFVFRPGTWLARAEEKHCLRYLDSTVPDVHLRETLRPTGRFGAKRPLVSPTFFELVQRPNVEIVSEQLVRVTPTGLVTAVPCVDTTNRTAELQADEKEVSREFDVIIWGTGFQMQGWGSMIPTRGVRGKLLAETWAVSPRTLFGTMTSDFPNMFIINGPNTVAPWASIIHGIEYQAASVARLIGWISKERKCKTSSDFWITPKVTEETKWTEAMQEPLDTLATSTRFGPGFYYLNKHGRNTFFFPFTLRYYWWRTRGIQKNLYDSSTSGAP